MPVFTYRAVNEDSKEVRGQIDSIDLDAATRALEDSHLEVVEIHEATRRSAGQENPPEQPPSLKTTFAFEGKDTAGTVRRGTIQSDTKYQAFERLKNDQKLFVVMLSPLGITPQYRDTDLENWQKKESPQKSVSQNIPTASPEVQKKKQIGFVSTDGDTASKILPNVQSIITKVHSSETYHPLVTTLRLYAGWLLVWYGLFVALGYYTHSRQLPWDLPFVEAFFVSPLIFSFIVAIFLFLILGSIHRAIHGRWISRFVIGMIGAGSFAGVQMSML